MQFPIRTLVRSGFIEQMMSYAQPVIALGWDADELEAELKARELARLRQLFMREKRQQLRKTGKQNLKSKNRRRELLAARSRKRNR